MLRLSWKPVRYQSANVVRSIIRCFNRLLHEKPYCHVWRGELAVIECKKTPSGMFYYHLHAILSGDYVPQSLISKDWGRISGYPNVWIEAVRSWRNAFHYTLKYILKGFTWKSNKDRETFRSSMKGTRFVHSYGSFYNSQYVAGEHVYFPCPDCGLVKCWVIDLEAFWREDHPILKRHLSSKPVLVSGNSESSDGSHVFGV
ncbi:hypothetical protein MUP46_04675 [Patescibacteria group bacterium]|nr:hypothetical protein [Patescibacteria group bacterium]